MFFENRGSFAAVEELMMRARELARLWLGLTSTQRAPSSPHLACGLNGSFFLRTCGLIPAVKAGRSFSFQEGAETCGTLRGWMVCATPMSTHARLNSVGPSGKRLVFFCGGVIGLECTYLLGLRANFDGLTWVRSKVRSL